MKIYELSVKRPIAVTMAVLVFVVLGFYSMTMLTMEMMPEMELSMALVYTSYPNVGSEEVENLVTKPIENAISSVSGVSSVTSQSSEGTSMVMVEFSNNTDMDQAVIDMEKNIDMFEAYLPENAETPMVMKLDTSMMPAAMLSVSYEGYDLIQTKQFIDDNIVNKLEAVDGVASVNVSGAQDKQIEVVIDPQKVFGYNMTLSDVVTAIAYQNQDAPAGTTEAMGKSMSVKTLGKFKDVKEIETVPLITNLGQVIYIRDIATVKEDYSDATTYARLNDSNAISISITAESDANTVDVVNGILKVLDEGMDNYPNFSYNMTMEQASYIEDSISSVAENAVVGCLLAIFILLLFLGSIKTSLIIGISMPISVVTTFIGMYFSGMTLNVVSLGGLALGVGMLVDNAVVVLENIFRRRDELGEDAKTASILGSKEVIAPVVASVLTTCIVYLPILFIDNMMAVMFKQLAFSIIFSQGASLLVTFLLLPMMSSRIKDTKERNTKLDFILKPFEKLMFFLYKKYEILLLWCLSHRKKVFGAIGIAVFISIVFLLQLGMTLMPASDEGVISISMELPNGSSLEESDEMCKNIENIVKENESVKDVFATVGSGGMTSMLGGSSSNMATITVTLDDNRRKTTEDVVQEIREQIINIPGAIISVEASSTSMSMSSDEIEFQFSGNDDGKLEDFLIKAEEVLASIEGIEETSTSITSKKQEVKIHIDPGKAAHYGMNTAVVSNFVRGALDGTTAAQYTEDGSEYDIIVQYPDDYVADYNQLKNLQIKTTTGQWVALSDIADVNIENTSTTLTRIDQKRVVTLTGKMYGTDMGTVNSQFTKKIEEVGLPEGITFITSGTYEIMIDAMGSLLLAILLGILLMYMVMAAQFESIKLPFIILMTIPLAIIGVVLSLVITWSPLSVVGCIGILMLMGIIVNNAIVLIDFVKVAKEAHPDWNRTQILVYAGKTRMRPILMTSLTSILGFLPMAVSTASGSEMMRPLATVLVGGLLVGTLLTLFVIPVFYTVFDDRDLKKKAKKEAEISKEVQTV